MSKVILGVREYFHEMDNEEAHEMASLLFEYGYIDKFTSKNIVDQTFNHNLNQLKSAFYRLTKEEEEFLQKLFKKYN